MKVGDRVYFGREGGEKTLGEVVKVNRRTVKVRQLESRGTLRDYPVGTLWRVATSLVIAAPSAPSPAAPADAAARRRAAAAKAVATRRARAAAARRESPDDLRGIEGVYPRRACLVNVITGRRTYGAWVNSPEEEERECEAMYERMAS